MRMVYLPGGQGEIHYRGRRLSKGIKAPMEKKQSKLASEIAHLREEKALSLVKELLDQGYDPMMLVNHCEDGMRRVGELYAQSKYSISGLIMGGEIFREAMEIISPLILAANTGRTLGKVLLGTVAGDIHDLGKNIVAILLQSIRCEIIDLGVDVPPAEFLRQAKTRAARRHRALLLDHKRLRLHAGNREAPEGVRHHGAYHHRRRAAFGRYKPIRRRRLLGQRCWLRHQNL